MKLNKYVDIDAVRRLYRSDLPAPVDVLNLIRFKDADAYRWYGLLVVPVLKAVGGQVGWFGSHERSFEGEPQADELGVVRYPNHRRFLMFVLNPYYMLVANPQRLKAVRAFQASFTHSPDSLDALSSSRWIVAVHHQGGEESVGAVRQCMTPTGARLVYHSEETSPIAIAKRPHPAGTNPLVFKSTALFEFESGERCEEALTPELLAGLKEAVGDVSVQLYRRLKRKEALPAAFVKLVS